MIAVASHWCSICRDTTSIRLSLQILLPQTYVIVANLCYSV